MQEMTKQKKIHILEIRWDGDMFETMNDKYTRHEMT